jgi:hypothetical protein
MAPGGIYITAGNTQLITTFDDQNGVTLSSPKGIDIGAKQGITFRTEKQVVISANNKIMLGTPNEEFPFSGLVLENEIQAVAPMMLMQCSESTSYESIKPPPPKKKAEKKINWTAAIVGTVVGVAVATVRVAAAPAPEAILAAGAALVAGFGEAAAVFGEIGSVLGTSAEAVAGADFVISDLYTDVLSEKIGLRCNHYIKPQKIGADMFTMRLYFNQEELIEIVSLSLTEDGKVPTWEEWSEETELKKKKSPYFIWQPV